MPTAGESVGNAGNGQAPTAPTNGATRLEDLLFCGFQTKTLAIAVTDLDGTPPPPWTGFGSLSDARTVAIAFAMERRGDGSGDLCCPGPAAPGPILAFGGTPLEFLRHVTGRGTGPNNGRGGGLSWSDRRRGLVAAAGPPGTMTQVMAGAAMAVQHRREPRAALVFESGRAADSGGWHEGLNLAASQHAPLILVMAPPSTPGGQDLPHRGTPADAYGVECLTVHDEPLGELLDRVGEARSHALGSGGPVLIRLLPLDPEEQWAGLDGLVDECRDKGLIPEPVLDELPIRAERDVNHALRRLEREPLPDPAEALAPVLDGALRVPPWTRQDPPVPGNRTPLNPPGGILG
ncbi:MAG: hypothetical protein HKN73_11120 [Gemmatimonadetes bacterium]|nr:hypothetical protein [Gemmatimonadota bacterium]